MSEISKDKKRMKWIIVGNRWKEFNLPDALSQFIDDWTKRFLNELEAWSYLYYSKSVAIAFDYDGVRYELKPSAFGLPDDAQAIMERHQREMTEKLKEMKCSSIMCFGEID